MRDVNRIPEILAMVSKIWYKHPDLRLCQLILNACENDQMSYYIEDEDLLAKLKKAYKEE
jgi:uncharacterized protein YihD (DUF1040 family)